MTLSDPVILAILGSVTSTVATLATLLVGLKTGRKADAIVAKADEIHSVTNSHLSVVTGALATANEKILGMEKLLAEMKENKVTVAATKQQP